MLFLAESSNSLMLVTTVVYSVLKVVISLEYLEMSVVTEVSVVSIFFLILLIISSVSVTCSVP
jgi:hypothetical protein